MSSDISNRSPACSVFAGSGEMRDLMRKFRWEETALGPVEQWPASLKTALSILLDSGYPTYIAWGPELIQFYNDAYRPILGTLKHPLALGQRASECYPEIWNFIGPIFNRVLKEGEPATFVDQPFTLNRNGHPETAYFTFSISAIRDENGKIGGIFATVMETTEKVAEEHARKQQAEASAELDRAKTFFFSNVSHEFRTPLTLLLGPVEELIETPKDELWNQAREHLPLIHRSARQLQKLVDSLLDFVRMDAGRIEAHFEPVNLSEFTTDLASLFSSAIERRGLLFKIDCPQPPPLIYVDRELYEKILFNLLSNALKFTRQGEITVRLVEEEERVTLQVADTGPGIQAEAIPKLFERFYRVRDRQGRLQNGTGIGLALVRELARLHGGDVSVQSLEGKGCTFSVTLPRGKKHLPADRVTETPTPFASTNDGEKYVAEAATWNRSPTAKIPAASSQPNGDAASKPLRVLLIEDNADLRDYVSRLLSGEFEVHATGNGEEALAIAAHLHPAIVLADATIPDLAEFALLETLKTTAGMENVPVIILSPRSGAEARQEALKAGADEYLVKPFGARELLVAIRSRIEIARQREERRKTEVVLRNAASVADQRARHILESITDAFYALDHEWRFTYVNAECERYLKTPRAELIGRVLWKLFPQALGTVFETNFRRAASGFPVHFESQSSFSGIWLEVHAYPAADGISVYFRDVGERKRVEDALRASEERFRRLVETSAFGLAIGDRHGGFSYANPTLLRILGFTTEEVIRGEMRWDRMTPPEFASKDILALKQLQERGFCDPYEKAFIARDGRCVPVLIGASIIDWDAHGDAEVAVMISDLTVLKNTEAALQQQAEVLREADRRKDEFLAMLAHELRNPLASLQSATDVLRQSGESEDRVWAENVLPRQITQLSRLVDDLLDVSRITRGVIHLRRSRYNVTDLIRNAVETVRPSIEERQHTFIYEYSPEPIWVIVDPTRFEQIILNLLTNAIKYTPHGGEIELAARTEKDELIVSVRDTGIGIAPEMLTSMWELFTQGERSIARSEGGLGVGLTIARRLAELHHGSVTAESPGLGKGSLFSVRIPLAPDVASAPSDPTAPVTPTAKELSSERRRILVVDDNADTAHGLQRLLSRQGYEVELAGDGLSALECAAKFHPDVVLLDIGLPGMDGYAVARRLRATPATSHILLIAISGYGQEEDRRQSSEAGFDHHFVKPVDFTELKSFLQLGRLA